MTNVPALPGSPETTAKLEPAGSPGGPAIHLRWDVDFACAAEPARSIGTMTRNSLRMTTPSCSPPLRGYYHELRPCPTSDRARPSHIAGNPAGGDLRPKGQGA